ncbi:MAG: hypothetical protein ACREU7_05445 [Burkholderiales bacterium]
MTDAALSRTPDPSSPAVASWVLVALAAWFAAVLGASLTGAFVTPSGVPPWPLLVAILAPVAVFALLYRLLPAIRAFVLGLDLRWLVLVHSWRFVGLSFMFLSAYGVLPLIFSVAAGVGDGLVAIGALLLGAGLYSGRGVSRRALLAWNTFGLADFIVAVGIGALSGSGAPLQAYASVPSDVMQAFPLAIVPGFLVPLFVITHLIIYIQLRAHWKGKERVQPAR